MYIYFTHVKYYNANAPRSFIDSSPHHGRKAGDVGLWGIEGCYIVISGWGVGCMGRWVGVGVGGGGWGMLDRISKYNRDW